MTHTRKSSDLLETGPSMSKLDVFRVLDLSQPACATKKPRVSFVYEPVQRWIDCGSLAVMYEELERPKTGDELVHASMQFQFHVLVTMAETMHRAWLANRDAWDTHTNFHHIEGLIGEGKEFFSKRIQQELSVRHTLIRVDRDLAARPGVTPTAVVTERSLYSSNEVFAATMKDLKAWTETENAIYDDAFRLWNLKLPNDGIPRSFMRLRTSDVHTCMARLKMRGRDAEKDVKIEYQQRLRDHHDRAFGGTDGYVAILADNSVLRLCDYRVDDHTTHSGRKCCIRCTPAVEWPAPLKRALKALNDNTLERIRGVVPVYVFVIDEDVRTDPEGVDKHIQRAADIIDHSLDCVYDE